MALSRIVVGFRFSTGERVALNVAAGHCVVVQIQRVEDFKVRVEHHGILVAVGPCPVPLPLASGAGPRVGSIQILPEVFR